MPPRRWIFTPEMDKVVRTTTAPAAANALGLPVSSIHNRRCYLKRTGSMSRERTHSVPGSHQGLRPDDPGLGVPEDAITVGDRDLLLERLAQVHGAAGRPDLARETER